MIGYLLRRVLTAIPVMGAVALFVFLLLRLTPGDPAAVLAGDNASPEHLAHIRASLGLDEPLYVQFFTWINHLLHADLGVSLISNVPVLSMIGDRVDPTPGRQGRNEIDLLRDHAVGPRDQVAIALPVDKSEQDDDEGCKHACNRGSPPEGVRSYELQLRH